MNYSLPYNFSKKRIIELVNKGLSLEETVKNIAPKEEKKVKDFKELLTDWAFVEMRNGNVGVVNSIFKIIIFEDGSHIDFFRYDNDLINQGHKIFDIMKIYKIESANFCSYDTYMNGKLIFDRTRDCPNKFSEEQIEKLKAIKTMYDNEHKFVARDDGREKKIFMYEKNPILYGNVYNNAEESEYACLYGNFDFITFENGPIDIDKAIEEYEEVSKMKTREFTYRTAIKLLKQGYHVKRAGAPMKYLYMENGQIKVEPSGLIWIPTKVDKRSRVWEA